MQDLRYVHAKCVHILGYTSDNNLQTALYITVPVAGFLDTVM